MFGLRLAWADRCVNLEKRFGGGEGSDGEYGRWIE